MLKHINKIIKYMVASDFFFNSAFASFAPFFSIFITDQIDGGSIKIAGFVSATYWVVKSVLQLPIAKFLDKVDGERTQFWAVFWGYLLSGFVPIMYAFSTKPWHLYVVEIFLAICMAWAVPAWYNLFTKHVDRKKVSFEWSLESVFAVGVATSLATAVGGYYADLYGFQVIFLCSGILAVSSAFLFLPLKNSFPHIKSEISFERNFGEKHHKIH
ncbi:MAG: MFS transporter [Candidatus Pacebacteria bacterium]|nr:MFS transporter [Candidatus Paceibacterota bacterium]